MRKIFMIALVTVATIALVAASIYITPLAAKPAFLRNRVERQIQSQLNESADPVYMPINGSAAQRDGKIYHSRFTMYTKWTNAYYVQVMHEGYYYQVSPRSVLEYDTVTGPEASVVDFLRSVRDGKGCQVPDGQTADCSFMEPGVGERKFKVRSIHGYSLVAEVTQTRYRSSSSASGDPYLAAFNEDEVKQVEQMLAATTPVPLKTARKSQFQYNI